MSKRRLTQRQLALQHKIQHARLERAKKRKQALEEQLSHNTLGPEQAGLLLAHYGANLVIESAEGTLHRCAQRQNLPALVTGDHVVWRAFSDGTGVVVALQPRHSELGRPDRHGHIRLMAANVDQIMIVIATSPPPLSTTLDRYLAAAHWLNIEPVIALNKSDLIASQGNTPLIKQIREYEAIGYRLIKASCESKEGLKELEEQLTHKTSVFAGQSGVGKSSLIAALIPDEAIQIGAISDATGKGRHTTTTTMLYHLPAGGHVIDSPGIREFGLWHLSRTMLEQGFKEFRPYLGQCKFKDCHHHKEPGCAIQAAVASREIAPWRVANYLRLAKDLLG